jgi:hypothetical protein
MDKLESTKNSMVARYTLVGDRCSKKFFEFHKGHMPQIVINELFHGEKILIEKEIIAKDVQSFYHLLYIEDLKVESNVQAR